MQTQSKPNALRLSRALDCTVEAIGSTHFVCTPIVDLPTLAALKKSRAARSRRAAPTPVIKPAKSKEAVTTTAFDLQRMRAEVIQVPLRKGVRMTQQEWSELLSRQSRHRKGSLSAAKSG